MTVNFSQLPDIPVQTGMSPPPVEGHRTVPIVFDFTAQQSYAFDFQMIMQQKKISFVQTLFIDNSASAVAAYLSITGANETIICPPFSQGYFPILVSGAAKMIFASAGGVIIPTQWLNFFIDAAIWNIQGAANVVNGKLQVQDTVLEGAVSNGNMNSLMGITASNTVIKPYWRGDLAFNLINAVAGPTAIIAAQGAGFGWFIDNIVLSVSNDSSLAAGGEITWNILDGATVLWSGIAYMPTAAPNTIGATRLFELQDIGYNSKSANVALNFSLSGAITTGHFMMHGTWGVTTIIT